MGLLVYFKLISSIMMEKYHSYIIYNYERKNDMKKIKVKLGKKLTNAEFYFKITLGD